MQRQTEPEVMDTPAEAIAYDQMDHGEVNRRFVDDLLPHLALLSESTLRVVDLGTGTALIPIELCRRTVDCRITAVDAAATMLVVAEQNILAAGVASQITLARADAKHWESQPFDVVMSNSLVHHLPEPAVFFQQAAKLTRSDGLAFVRDLFRPANTAEWQHLVDTYAGEATPHQRQLFADSLRAALTVAEVQELVAAAGFSPDTVTATSDRHWTWVARKAE